VTGLLDVPRDPVGPAILLAPGAGAGQDHPFLSGLRSRFAAAGHTAMTFDYPYREAGRRAPDRPDVLARCHRAAAARLRRYEERVVFAGKSMGGRIASHLLAEGDPAAGLVAFGYPLVPIGSREPRSTDHLRAVEAPMLFLAGGRDRMAPLELLESVVASLRWATLEVVEDADHSFRVPKRTGIGPDDMLDLLTGATLRWMEAHRLTRRSEPR
jgi:predicted alpha/beta-hydrolase family hydrolase